MCDIKVILIFKIFQLKDVNPLKFTNPSSNTNLANILIILTSLYQSCQIICTHCVKLQKISQINANTTDYLV